MSCLLNVTLQFLFRCALTGVYVLIGIDSDMLQTSEPLNHGPLVDLAHFTIKSDEMTHSPDLACVPQTNVILLSDAEVLAFCNPCCHESECMVSFELFISKTRIHIHRHCTDMHDTNDLFSTTNESTTPITISNKRLIQHTHLI